MYRINSIVFLLVFQSLSVFASNNSQDSAAASSSDSVASSGSQRPVDVAHEVFLALCKRYPDYFRTPPPQEGDWVDGININRICYDRPQDLLQDPEARGCLENEVGELWWALHKGLVNWHDKLFFVTCIRKVMIELGISGFKLRLMGDCYTEKGWQSAISHGLEVIRFLNSEMAHRLEELMDKDDYEAAAVESEKELHRKLGELKSRKAEILGSRFRCAIQ